jgi:hypothetical protein
MSTYKKYCKNILKQYGKNIKKFEERLDNPLDDSEVAEICEKHEIPYQRRLMVSAFLRRGHTITCFRDLEDIANA